jgi:hypothetical protein
MSEKQQLSHLQSSAIVSVTLEFAMSLSDPDKIEKLMRTEIAILKTGIFETDKFRATNDGSPQTAARSNDIAEIANSVAVWVIPIAVIGTLLLIVAIVALGFFLRRSRPRNTSSGSNQTKSALTLDFCFDGGMTEECTTESDGTATNSMTYEGSAVQFIPSIGQVPVMSLALI